MCKDVSQAAYNRDNNHSFLLRTCSAVLLGSVLLFAIACIQTQPFTSPVPTLEPTQIPAVPSVEKIEGLVMVNDSQLIIGVNWLSKSRITYLVKGGNAKAVEKLVGETALVYGEVLDHNPWLKEIIVYAAEASTAPNRLSRRIGYVKELGPSIYMQGTHVLVDYRGKLICLLEARESWLKLDMYIGSKVAVIGFISETVEGDAQIMDVKLVELVK